ncbi:MAG: YheU family protein [Pseudomonadota bacterium]
MIIPHQQLSPEALRGLIEEYITRDGTDYGIQEISLMQKVQQVEQQINRGDVVVVFDIATESVSLLSRRDAQALTQHESSTY